MTAAVVGVILNLALVFGAAVVWPNGFASSPDWFALALSAATMIALVRFKAEVLWVIAAGHHRRSRTLFVAEPLLVGLFWSFQAMSRIEPTAL